MLDPCPEFFGIPYVQVLYGQRIKFSPLAQTFWTCGIMRSGVQLR
jgi:hypothetical protein